MPPDRDGDFRGEIVEYGIEEGKEGSQAVMVAIKVKLNEWWEPGQPGAEGQWHPWAEYDQEAYGRVCVVKTDGTLNSIGCEQLIKGAGWDGDFVTLDDKTWKPKPCMVWVKPEEYKGKTQFKVASVKAFDATPGGGGLSSVGTEKARALSARYGGALRAMKGSLATNAKPAPAGKPAAPSKPPKAPVAAAAANGDEIPF
jgi:hypothetical protein